MTFRNSSTALRAPSIGELNTRIAIRTLDNVPNAQMGSDLVYGTPLFVWANIKAVSGSVYYGSQQIDQAITHKIVIRTGPDITAKHVIESSEYRYRVKRVSYFGNARQYTVIDAEEIAKVV